MMRMMVAILAFLVFFIVSLNAQVDDLLFKQIFSENGRTATGTYSTIEDRFGFIWFAYGGSLIRFDGEELLFFNSEPFEENSFSSGTPFSLVEDNKGRIMIATSMDLCRYDPLTGHFDHFVPPISDTSSNKESTIVFDVIEDSNGILWVSTEFGLYNLDDQTGIFSPVYMYEQPVSELKNRLQAPIIESVRGDIFIGTPDGLFLKRQNSTVLELIEFSGIDTSADVRRLSEDEDGTLWISVWEKGLYRLEEGELQAESIYFSSYDEEAEINKKIISLQAGSTGIIWLGCEFDGLYGYNSKSEKLDYLPFENGGTGMIAGSYITCVFEDSQKNLWVTLREGQFRANLEPERFKQALPGKIVFGITEYNENEYFVGLDDGVLFWNRETGQVSSLSEALGFPIPDVEAFVMDILVDSQGKIWIAFLGEGIILIEPELKSYKWYRSDAQPPYKISSNLAILTHEDLLGKIWISLIRQGLSILDEQSGAFVLTDLFSQKEIPDADFFREDPEGNIWIGRRFGGVAGINRETGNVVFFNHISDDPKSLVGDNIIGFDLDSKGNLWAGDGSYGISVLNPVTGQSEHITTGSGLPSGGIMSILVINPEDVWVGTMFGLVHISGPEREIQSYFVKDGLPSNEFNALGGSLMASDGTLLFGTMNGILWFDPENIDVVERSLPTRILNIKTIDGKNQWNNAYILDDITVPWRDNSITLSYRTLDMRPNIETSYSVKMEGFDEDWIDMGFSKQTNYSRLPGGKYTFYVKSSNVGVLWSKEENWGRLTINVQTHPLKTWWAISSYVILGMAIIIAVFLRYHSFQQKKLIQERSISDRLRKVDNLKDQFLANTTHELRTPLNGIIGLAESLIEDTGESVSQGTKKELSFIASSGRRLSFLINDILDLSRLKEGDISLNKSSMNLSRLVNTVLVLSKPLVAGKSLELINLVPEDLPPVEGDINRVQQILHNLIGNAIKFTSEGEISISAGILGKDIEITVQDTGIGIPLEKQNVIWQSFQQIDASSNREYSGTGLGLPITKQLVEMHGGTIRLESGEGKGSSFIFTLPVSEQSEQSESEKTIAAVQIPIYDENMIETGTSEEKLGQILYIDDDSMNLHVVVSQLKGSGYSLKTASSGEEALSQLDEIDPDLILLDSMMPIMDGYEVCRKIREQYTVNELPVILVTAKNQVADLVEGLSAGANDFISKPYSRKELLARIETHLAVKSTHNVSGRFVPKELLRLMKHLQSGDKVERDMSLMMADMGMTNGSTNKSSQIFDFFSSFVEPMLSVIKNHNGIIEGYRGDSLVGLFPEEADEAIKAAIDLENALIQYNQEKRLKGAAAYVMGIVLHRGPFVLGTIGTEGNMKEALVSDSISVVRRMSTMSRNLSAPLLVSETILNPENCFCEQRFIGKLNFSESSKDSDESFLIYEILSGEGTFPEGKLKTKDQFEEGLNNFYNERFEEASLCMRGVLEINPDDAAAVYYREKAIGFISQSSSQ